MSGLVFSLQGGVKFNLAWGGLKMFKTFLKRVTQFSYSLSFEQAEFNYRSS